MKCIVTKVAEFWPDDAFWTLARACMPDDESWLVYTRCACGMLWLVGGYKPSAFGEAKK